ncbi:MAG: hypothetical protein MJ153_05090 [Clostridia bacterium]|nr:hypothetical protein [Clostridia bacterium]
MASIDSIIERIIAEAHSNADARIKRANDEADKLVSKKITQGTVEGAKMLSEAQASIDANQKQARAAHNTNSQRRLLQERVNIINEVIDEAKRRIEELPSRERLQMIEKFVLDNSEGQDGKLIVARKDLAEIPADFAASLSSKTRSKITVSDEPGNFSCGCILICDEYEYNGTLDALIDDNIDQIRDAVNRILFT